jgi:dipeptidyl aminopeptidase/acylaminoacyl peptidase
VTLNGDLVVTRTFTPTLGDRFAIMTFAGRTGQFANVSLPLVDGLVLDTLWAIDADPIDTLYIVANAPPAPRILFAGDSAGGPSSGIFSVNPDGTGQFQITTEGPPGETTVHPRWSPDRTRVTYSARAGRIDANQLHIRTADGGEVWHLTSPFDTSTFRPRYSPDGVHLAFECGPDTYPTGAQDVCVIADVRNPFDAMGDGNTGKAYVTDSVDITLGGSGAFAWNPQNPDQLAVVRDAEIFAQGPLGSAIWLVNFDGSNPVQLTAPIEIEPEVAVQIFSMDWAPDGSFIVFDGLRTTGERAIFRVEVGAEPTVTQLTFPATFQAQYRPVVSPDNSEILFGEENDLWTLMRVPAGGGNPVQVTPFMNFPLADGQAGWDWSPDGAEIVLTTDFFPGLPTYPGVFIAKILASTTDQTYDGDVKLVGRFGTSGSVQDRQPSWRP